MTHSEDFAERVAELEALAAAEGLRLPMPAGLIALYERRGDVVDLRSGAVTRGGADSRLWPKLCWLGREEGAA